MTCTCTCSCPLSAGDQIRSTRLFNQDDPNRPTVRLNGACPQWLAYLSDEWAVYRTYVHYSDGLRFLKEEVVSRPEFDRDFERDPRRQPEPVDAPPRYPATTPAEKVPVDPEW